MRAARLQGRPRHPGRPGAVAVHARASGAPSQTVTMCRPRQRPVGGRLRPERARAAPPGRRGLDRPPRHLGPPGRSSWRPARTSTLEIAEGALLLEAAGHGGDPVVRRRPGRRQGRRRCRPSSGWLRPWRLERVRRSSAGARRSRPRRATRCRCGSTGRGPWSAPGTSCSPVLRRPAPAPPSGSRRGRHGLRRAVPAARSTRSARAYRKGAQQHARRRPRRPRQPLGHRRAPKAATPPSTPSSAPSRTSPICSRPRRPTAWRWPSTTPCSARPTTRGSPSIRSGSTTGPTASIAYAENPPKKYQDIYPINFWPDDEADRGRAVGGVQGHPRLLDRARRADLPGRQPAHQADRLLGVAHPRRAEGPPRRRLPGRGLHPARR